MRPSSIVFGIILFVGCLMLIGNFIGNFTSNDSYNVQLNESKYNNTFSKFNQTKYDLLGTQELLNNETLKREEGDVFTNDNILTASIQALSGLYKSGSIAKDLIYDTQDSMHLPFNAFDFIVLLMVFSLIFGLIAIYLKTRV